MNVYRQRERHQAAFGYGMAKEKVSAGKIISR
jgi:hypothetical protein